MTNSERDRHVRAVRALTRFHFGRRNRRRLRRDAARDRASSNQWGWHENIIGVGVSWKRANGRRHPRAPCITFYVLRKEPRRRLLPRERIPERLDFESVDAGVQTDVVEVPGHFVAHASRVRPVRPGAEVGHVRGGRGTLGPIVQKVGGSTVLALSCSHVLARSGNIEDVGRKIEQPVSENVADAVGTLTEFTVIRAGSLVTADVALAALSVPAASRVLGSTVIPATFSPREAKDFGAIAGAKTVLFGSVTRGAQGDIEAFEATLTIDEMPFVNGPVQLSRVVTYNTSCAKGDSGGLVMSGQAGEKSMILGIHTAGRSDGQMGVFQPIGPIMSRFNLALVTASN
jgi:hypothetical protein